MSDEFESEEYFEDDWDDGDEESRTIACSECGIEVYEDAEICPRCGCFLDVSPGGSLVGMPPWVLVLGLLGILATLLTLAGLF